MIIYHYLMLQHSGVEGQPCSMRWGDSKLRTTMKVQYHVKFYLKNPIDRVYSCQHNLL